MHNPLFIKTLELSKEELISEIIDLFNGLSSTDSQYEPATVAHQELIQTGITDLFNNFLEKESITKTSEITILLSDLRGFTAMVEQFPAVSIVEMLNRYFSKMSEIIITDHDGVIDKFMGDAIMILFRSRKGKADALERALSCAVHMQISMDEVNRENESLGLPALYMGIGINTGTVITGKVGSNLHSEYTVIGDEVNLVSCIEAFTLRGQILISENTYLRAKDYIETSDPTSVFVKGKKDQVSLYELLSIKRPSHLSVPRREARKSPRIDIDMPFTYQHIDERSILPEKHSGQILNIGYNGLLSVIPEQLEVFTEIKLTIALSMLGDEVSDIYAKVLHTKKQNGQYLTNIEFTSVHIYAKKAIKLFIDRMIQGCK
jgi:adenylate cyclase